MFKAVATRAESYDDWASKVGKILKAEQDKSGGCITLSSPLLFDCERCFCDCVSKGPLSHPLPPDLEDLRTLIVEAEKKMYPETDLSRHLRQIIQDAEKSALMAQQLLNGKRQTRYKVL